MFDPYTLGRYLVFAASCALATSFADEAVAADKVTITFANWASAEGTTKPAIEQVIADFEKAHPDIQIKSEAISFSEIARQLVLRINAGNPPDVAQLAGNDTFVVAATGKLETLTALRQRRSQGATEAGRDRRIAISESAHRAAVDARASGLLVRQGRHGESRARSRETAAHDR